LDCLIWGLSCRAGAQDFRRAPLFGIAFSLVYVLGGLILYAIFLASGQSWWFIPIAVGISAIGPICRNRAI
jgi:hypothetical protein